MNSFELTALHREIERSGWNNHLLSEDDRRVLGCFLGVCQDLGMRQRLASPTALRGYAHVLVLHAIPRMAQPEHGGVSPARLREVLALAIPDEGPHGKVRARLLAELDALEAVPDDPAPTPQEAEPADNAAGASTSPTEPESAPAAAKSGAHSSEQGPTSAAAKPSSQSLTSPAHPDSLV